MTTNVFYGWSYINLHSIRNSVITMLHERDIASIKIKNVLVLYVGGTIGMEKNENHVYIPSSNKLFEKLKGNSQMHSSELANKFIKSINTKQLALPLVGNDLVLYELKEYDPLLDSSNMSASDWIRIAKDIEVNHKNFDGFVILHGTDTLAYTSSALSFMLEGVQKPVILTGSQIPIFETRSDAKDNILSSLILAGCYNIPEVCVFFANKLLRGNRTAKVSSTHLDAFDSPNYHALAEVGIDIILNKLYLMRANGAPFKVHTKLNSNVGLLSLFPTITPSMLRALLQKPLEGLVLQSYGVGNIPSNQKELIQVIKEAVNSGIVIVNITQCAQGTVSTSYETGKALENIGVISGHDMTAEAALTKLCFVLGLPGLSYDQRITLMKENIRGELTNNNNNNNNNC